jgi:hypothetical protein
MNAINIVGFVLCGVAGAVVGYINPIAIVAVLIAEFAILLVLWK